MHCCWGCLLAYYDVSLAAVGAHEGLERTGRSCISKVNPGGTENFVGPTLVVYCPAPSLGGGGKDVGSSLARSLSCLASGCWCFRGKYGHGTHPPRNGG